MSGDFDFISNLAAQIAQLFRPGGGAAKDASWSIASVLSEVCTRAGVPPDAIGYYNINGVVDGCYTGANDDAFNLIEQLQYIFLFDAASFDGRINFIARGGPVVAEITDADLVEDGEETTVLARGDAITVPRVLHMEYYDFDGGLTPDKQTSDRSLDSRAKSEAKDQSTVILRTADASKAVAIKHKIMIEEQRGEFTFSLPDSFINITTGDVVNFNGQRVRIIECEIDEAQQNYKAVFDRLSSYSSEFAGVAIQTPTDPQDNVIEDTRLEFIDSHILRDADDRLGYYVALNGLLPTWTGAAVELSLDGGATYTQSLSGSAWAEMGETETVLPAHPVYYPDTVNSVQVRLINTSEALESTTLAGMQSRANLAIIGNELINFGDVDEIEPGLWELSHLLRGRKGSAISEHPAGTRFVLLDRNSLFFIDAETFSVSRTLTFRATSFGGDMGVVSSYTYTGRSQIERQPGYLAVQRTGGNLVISWQGAGRVGGGVLVSMGVHFAGYRVTVNGTAYDTAAQTYTVTDPGGAVTVTVQQRNTLTGLGPAAEIIL